MWKKEEEPAARPAAAARPSAPQPSPERTERATIGRSIRIQGEVTGDEDLLIEGRIDGSVDLKRNAVTVGSGGEVRANISGRVVTVDGTVTGNLTAEEQVILSGTAQVEGDITAPRVVLEDGASFRGGVDMGDHAGAGSSASKEREQKPEKGSQADAKADSGPDAQTAGAKEQKEQGSTGRAARSNRTPAEVSS